MSGHLAPQFAATNGEGARRVASAVRRSFRGEILAPGDAGFDSARTIWNRAAEREPGLILRCADVADVQSAVRCAGAEGVLTAVRCGGHSLAGFSTCEGGVVIDLSHLRHVALDAPRRRARVGGGSLLGTIDQATSAAGLVFPAGVVSHTGASGLILGGGTGWLTRRFGLSCDNVESYTLVTASGEIVRASETENPDLFWGLRGGGGNFGIVPEFTLRLHALASVLIATGTSYGDEIARALRFWRDFMPGASENLKWNLSVLSPPCGDAAPPALSHTAIWTGDADQGRALLSRIFGAMSPANSQLRQISYLELQTMADSEFPHGDRYYSKSGYFAALDDATLDFLASATVDSPSAKNQVEIAYLGGAAARVGATESAFGDRSAPVIVNLLAQWKEPVDDAANVQWVRSVFGTLRPKMRPGVYVNFMSGDEGERTGEVYGSQWQRLLALKKHYDPQNFFRLNQNLTDSSAARA